MANSFKKLSKELKAELQAAGAAIAPTYVADPNVKPIAIEDYELVERDGKYGPFTVAVFEADGSPFSFNLKSGVSIDEESPIMVQRFVASRDFTLSNGDILPAGKVKWMVTQS